MVGVSYISSNGSTIRSGKTGQKNHTTTSRKEAGKGFGNFIGGIPTHQETISSPKHSPTTNERVRRNQALRPCSIDNEERQRPARRLRPTIQLTTLFTPSRPRNLTNKEKATKRTHFSGTKKQLRHDKTCRKVASDSIGRKPWALGTAHLCTYTYEGRKGAWARTPSREGHSFHVSHTRKSVICSRPGVPDPAKRRTNPVRVNDRGRRAHQQAADPGGQRTPLCAHHWLVRLARAWSLLSCAPAEGRQDAH